MIKVYRISNFMDNDDVKIIDQKDRLPLPNGSVI